MTSKELFVRVAGLATTLVLVPAFGCSQSGPGSTTKNDAAMTGGTSSGGTTATGGTIASGGASGSGGVAGSGGTTASGGTVGNGGSGGTTASGGTTSPAGGTTGTTSSGGTKATGGATSSGGATASGGSAGGGTTAAGGTTGPGGTTGSGGVTGTGGSTAKGGSTGTGGVVTTGGTTGGGGSTCPDLPAAPTGTTDAVAGSLVQFNDNGGWCWYQDERAIVDVKGNKLVIGSVASGSGREGAVEVVIYDLASKQGSRAKLGTMSYTDDHDAPGLALRPDGGYAAMWAGHNNDCYSYYSVYNGSSWAAQKTFDWTSLGCPTSSGKKITYSNMWYLDSKLYSAVRSVDTSPNFLVSSDNGGSFAYGGRLTTTPQVGYVAGYYKYWGNNTDRLDFVGTEAHPRDNDNSLYHGYVKGGKVYNSAGTVIDSDVTDKTGQDITKYTQLFKTGTTVGGVKLDHAWNADLMRYDDGTIALIWTARVAGTGSDDPDKRLLYARFDGSKWSLTYLVKAGTKLYADEQDYTGLGALHPDNPNVIYISTPYNPSDDTTKTTKREIYQGVTCDNGVTWKWVPVTKGSTMDNIRPIVPKWDAAHTALLWLRGTYSTAQSYALKVVGTISGP